MLRFMGEGNSQRGDPAVAELQGLDGSFCFAERLLQRIWHRGDFDRSRAITVCGAHVRILAPGSWNRLGGPDFFNARLEIDGHRVVGDVEMHLRASDWSAHGHQHDPKYRQVVLHVVLFPPQHICTRGVDGREIPILALLPLLYRSLEEHAEDDVVERLANHPLTQAQEVLAAKPPEQLRAEVRQAGEARWAQKLRIAALRTRALGWEEACHQTALEVLGYRANRGPMLMTAAAYPLRWWAASDRLAEVDTVYLAQKERWAVQAIRPANQPRTRLRQYAAWTGHAPDWPTRLRELGQELLIPHAGMSHSTRAEEGTTAFRKHVGMPDLRVRWFSEVCGRAVRANRFDTLACDAFWPLLAVCLPDSAAVLRQYWYHWYVGDVPETVARLSAWLGLTDAAGSASSHGLLQGLLACVWREEVRANETPAC